MNSRVPRLTAREIEAVADRLNPEYQRGLSLPPPGTPSSAVVRGQPPSVEELILRLQGEAGAPLVAALLRLRLLSLPPEEALRRTADEWKRKAELRGRLLEELLYPEAVSIFLGAALLALPALAGTGLRGFSPTLLPIAFAAFALATTAPLLPRCLAGSRNRLTKGVLLRLLLEGTRLSGSLAGAVHRCRGALEKSGFQDASLRRCEASLLEGAELRHALSNLVPPLEKEEIAFLTSNADRRRAERALLALEREEAQLQGRRERRIRAFLPAGFLLILGALLLTAAVTVVLPYMERILHLP